MATRRKIWRKCFLLAVTVGLLTLLIQLWTSVNKDADDTRKIIHDFDESFIKPETVQPNIEIGKQVETASEEEDLFGIKDRGTETMQLKGDKVFGSGHTTVFVPVNELHVNESELPWQSFSVVKPHRSKELKFNRHNHNRAMHHLTEDNPAAMQPLFNRTKTKHGGNTIENKTTRDFDASNYVVETMEQSILKRFHNINMDEFAADTKQHDSKLALPVKPVISTDSYGKNNIYAEATEQNLLERFRNNIDMDEFAADAKQKDLNLALPVKSTISTDSHRDKEITGVVKTMQQNFHEGFHNNVDMDEFAANAKQQNLNVALPTKSVTLADSQRDMQTANMHTKDGFNSVDNVDKPRTLTGNRQNNETIKVVSMSLYGSQPRYTIGAIRNAELIKENFPGWVLRIYTESPLSEPRFELVPRKVLEKLRSLGVDIQYVVPEQDFIPPMMWRFLVADDLSVDYFIIRDCDSRLTQRDAAAVGAWIQSGKPFHSVRDHPSHANYAVSGGLWGGKTKELRDILRRSWIDLMRGSSSGYLEDMNFLNNVIWPRVQAHVYCSDSVSCLSWPNSHPFPVPRYGYDHVGQVFDERDIGRLIDIRLLRAAGENRACTNITES